MDQLRGGVMSATKTAPCNATAPVTGREKALMDLESLICDVANLANVSASMAENIEFDAGASKAVVTYSQASRIVFMAGETWNRAMELQKAYYEAFDKEDGK